MDELMDDGVERPADPAPPPQEGRGAIARFGLGVVRGIGIAALALFVAFAIANMHPVEFSWLFGRTEVVTVGGERVSGGVPLILLLLGAFVLGVIVNWAMSGLRARARRRAAGR